MHTHRVKLGVTGTSFDARSDETILAAAARQGIRLASACRNGGCGCCKAEVNSGLWSQAPTCSALAAAERPRALLTCCAYARSDVCLELSELVGVEADEPAPIPARVLSLSKPTVDLVRLTLRLPPKERLTYRPGQFIGVIADDGEPRFFSIANSPRADNTLDLHVGLVPGGRFSGFAASDLREGALLRLKGPFGNFVLTRSHRPIIFVAGGTGIAPILGMLEQLAVEDPGRGVTVYWGSRSSEGFYAEHELRACGSRLDRFRYEPIVSGCSAEWSGRSGFVHEAVIADCPSLQEYEIYCCGNEAMVAAALRSFTAAGLAAERFHSDTFVMRPLVPANVSSQSTAIECQA